MQKLLDIIIKVIAYISAQLNIISQLQTALADAQTKLADASNTLTSQKAIIDTLTADDEAQKQHAIDAQAAADKAAQDSSALKDQLDAANAAAADVQPKADELAQLINDHPNLPNVDPAFNVTTPPAAPVAPAAPQS